MITARRAVADSGRRSTFCYIALPRGEQRHTPGDVYPHIAYLIRLSSDRGTYPSDSTWYEMRFSRIARLHEELKVTHQNLRLPWLPRARWLGSRHPNYVAQMCTDLQRYFQQLISSWCRHYGSFNGFILLMHAVQSDLPLPSPSSPDNGGVQAAGVDALETDGARARLSKETTLQGDCPEGAPATSTASAVIQGLDWHRYQMCAEASFSIADRSVGRPSSFEDIRASMGSQPWALWRVVNFDLVKQNQCCSPKLLQRSAYIVLAAPEDELRKNIANGCVGIRKPPLVAWRVHFWIGVECGADQAGAAAALAVQLSCTVEAEIGHPCRQMREVQGCESHSFRALFQHLSYAEGGDVTNYWRKRHHAPTPPRLFWVSGDRPYRLGNISQTSLGVEELDEGACYVLDAPSQGQGVPSEIFQWHGHTASLRDKAFAMLLSHAIRSNDRHGLGTVHVLSPHDRRATVEWEAMLPVPLNLSSPYHRFLSHLQSVQSSISFNAEPQSIYRVESKQAAVAVEQRRPWPPPCLRVWRAECLGAPLCSTILITWHAIVLNCESDIFVWCGRSSCGYTRWSALALADQLSKRGRSKARAIHRESEGTESTMFRCKFARWHWVKEANVRPSPTLSTGPSTNAQVCALHI